jgi:hypothetical protein
MSFDCTRASLRKGELSCGICEHVAKSIPLYIILNGPKKSGNLLTELAIHQVGMHLTGFIVGDDGSLRVKINVRGF